MPHRNPNGIEISPGLRSGNQSKFGTREQRRGRAGDNRRECHQQHCHDQSAIDAEDRTHGVEALPEQVVQQRWQVGRCRDGKGQRHQEGDVQPLRGNREQDRDRSDAEGGDPGHDQLALLRRLSLLEHVGVEVMGDRGRRGEGEAGDHCEDRGERDGRDHGQQDRSADRALTAADRLRQQRRGGIARRRS